MLDSVIAKFTVQSVEKQGDKDYQGVNTEAGESPKPRVVGIKVNLAPVYAPKDAKCENAKFWEATPSGQLWMQINNPACFDFFQAGEDIYLTFERADRPNVSD
jgi:hypothetical protein